jgi:SAM-dependent methyltransferase
MAQSIAFDRAAAYYDDTRGFPPGVEKSVAELIARVGEFTTTSRVLEIGVGTGRIALPTAPYIGAYHGLDLSPAMMKRLSSKKNGEPIYLTQGDATRLPYPDDSFDAVIAVHVFHLIPNWRGVVDELVRVLRPDRPVIHCWTQTDEVFKTLWDAWRGAIPSTNAEDVGIRWEKNSDFLSELGWQANNDIHEFAYTYERTPSEFARSLENRIWSQTWRLTDDELAKGVEAVRAEMGVRYSEPDNPVQVTSRFCARAFYPPIQ